MALENVRDGYPDVYFSDICLFPSNVDALLNKKFWDELP
jgi:hypothetical protein